MADTEKDKKQAAVTKRFDFYFVELCVFLSQAIVIFIVAYFVSDMLQSEERLTIFVNNKLNSLTMSEFGLTLFAVTFVLGLLYIIRDMAPSPLVERIAGEVINELPRTI